MSAVLSMRGDVFDGSSAGFRRSAVDISEVIALLRGGVQPDAETLSRLGMGLHRIRDFLLLEAEAQAYRERIMEDPVITEVVSQIVRAPSVALPPKEVVNVRS